MFADLFDQRALGNLLVALLVLVGGWLVALIISRLIRALLKRTRIDDRLAVWVQGEDPSARSEAPRIERIISTIIFWLLMLVVIVAVLNILQLSAVAGPFNTFLNEIAAFAPRLLSAAFLALIAWVVATVLRIVVRAALNAVNFDQRLREETEVTPPDDENLAAGTTSYTTPATATRPSARPAPSLSNTIATTVYWLVFLFFLPAILDALGLSGLLGPVQALVNDILTFLPSLALAALILLAGWFVARIVQRIVTNILYATGIDNLGEEAGLGSMGNRRVSEVLGFIAYVLVLLVVATIALDTLNLGAVTRPISNMLDQVLAAVPNIFAAAILLLLAYVAGRLVAGLVANILSGLGFDRIIARLGMGLGRPGAAAAPMTTPTAAGRTPSEIAGYVVLVALMLFATVEALELVGFESLAALVAQFIVFAGQVLLGLIIFGVGLYIANLAAEVILQSAGQNAGLLALAARVSILVLAGAMALRQMGLAPEIIQTAFTLLIGAIAVAVALAFGLGSRDVAGRLVQDWVRDIETGDANPNPYNPTQDAGED